MKLPRPAIHLEKSLLIPWVGPLVGWDRISGDLQDGANSISQVDGVSDMVPTCQLCCSVVGRFRKQTMASAHLSFWEKAVPQLSP